MSVQAATKPEADIRPRGGSKRWHCPGCGKVLCEIVGSRLLVVRHSLHWSCPIVPGMAMTCPYCHQESVYPHSC